MSAGWSGFDSLLRQSFYFAATSVSAVRSYPAVYVLCTGSSFSEVCVSKT
jgi:hypothetical protein